MSGEKEGLIEHHTHYKEIDGYDETVWMTPSEHRLLHNRLRREGKCNIPAEELAKISNIARNRTDKVKKYKKKWFQDKWLNQTSEDRKRNLEYQKEYRERNKERVNANQRIRQAKYRENNREKIKIFQKEWRERQKEKKNEKT